MANMGKNAWHRFIFVGCALVTLIIAVVWLPAASAEQKGVLTYILNGTEATITKCDTSATDEDVAAAFYNITSSAIKITGIGDSAFSRCTGLTSINIPDGVTSIGNYTFASCKGLTEITLPDDLTSIGSGAFGSCTGLTEINLPAGLTSMGAFVFEGCTGLTKISLPDSLTSIGNTSVFSGCTGLTEINLPDGLTSIGDHVFANCTGLTEIDLPAGLTSIGIGAFSYCTGLTEINLPTGLTSIGNSAFRGCANLDAILVDESNLSYFSTEGVLFDKTGTLILYPPLKPQNSYGVPDEVTNIGDEAFYGCTGLTEINLPDGLKRIEDGAFSYCTGLTEIDLPDSLTNIEMYAFFGCTGLTEITLPTSLTSIGQSAFGDCTGLAKITLLSCTSIGVQAFSGCTGLTEIKLPDDLTSIGDYAFSGCTGLTEIKLPVGLTSIGNSALRGCANLETILVDEDNLSYFSIEGVLLDKSGTLILYPSRSPQNNFDVPVGVASIGNSAFSGCTGLMEIKLPDDLTSIGNSAFYGCTGLTEITLPNGLTSIGNSAFYGCTGLTELKLPDDLTSIGDKAFYGCTGLAGSLTIPAGLISIGSDAFGAFRVYSSLSEIIIEHGMLDLPLYFLTETAFNSNLKLYVPTSVISVGGQPAFSFELPSGTTLSRIPTIYGVTESFIVAWAKANAAKGMKLQEINGTVTKFDYGDAWRNVPYQYIIETVMPDNFMLKFEIVDGDLPEGLDLMQKGAVYEGLTLLSGQFYGAPLETGKFEIEVEVRIDVGAWNYLLDWQKITLSVDIPSDAVLTGTVNDYDITTSIGAIELDGAYWVTVFKDQVYEIADADLDGDGMIERNFPDFVHFWIDGKVLVRYADYDADEGSTVVTIYAKTFQALDDDAVHTASAEFSIKGVQTVAAQNFHVNLPEPDPEQNPDPDPESDPEQNPDTEPDPDSEQNPDPEPDSEQKPDTEPEPETDTDTTPNPEQNTPARSGNTTSNTANESANTAEASQAPTLVPTDTDTTDIQDNSTGTDDAAGTQNNADGIQDDATDNAAPPAAPAAPAVPNPDIAPAPQEIGGLLRDANGMYYFVLDGSGAPFEARIDIPLAEYEDMYFDGDLWTLGADYETREGSTILVITTEKLSGFAYGMHEISARFTEDRTVAFTFDLRGAQVPAAAESAGPTTPAESSVTAPQTPASRSPILPFVMLIFGVAMLLSSTFTLRARRRAVN